MNLQVRSLPHRRHQRVTDPELLSQLSGRPVRRSIGRLARCPLQDASFHGRSQDGSSSPLLSRVQPGDASFKESALPPAHVAPVASELRLNRCVRLTLGQQQNQPCSACVLGPNHPASGSALQLFSIRPLELQLFHAVENTSLLVPIARLHSTSPQPPLSKRLLRCHIPR